MWSAENFIGTTGTLTFGECRNDRVAVPPGDLECLPVKPYFSHLHRTGAYRYEQTTGKRRRVAGGKWVAMYSSLTMDKQSKRSGVLRGIYHGLGGELSLGGHEAARGVVSMVAYVREVAVHEVPVNVRAVGLTHAVELVHVRPVWPPLCVSGLQGYRGRVPLMPGMQAEIRARLC